MEHMEPPDGYTYTIVGDECLVEHTRTGMGCLNLFLGVWLSGWTLGGVFEKASNQFAAGRFETSFLLAELECMEGTPLFNPTLGVLHAESAYSGKEQDQYDGWKRDVLLCKAYAYTSQFDLAQSRVETARSSGAPEAIVTQLQELIAVQHDQRQRSYRIAFDSLLHEGNTTNRVIGGVIFCIAAGGQYCTRSAGVRKGWAAGMAAGAFCAGISALIPVVMAILFRIGEGAAFQQLMLAAAVVVALIGSLAGCVAGAYGKRLQ